MTQNRLRTSRGSDLAIGRSSGAGAVLVGGAAAHARSSDHARYRHRPRARPCRPPRERGWVGGGGVRAGLGDLAGGPRGAGLSRRRSCPPHAARASVGRDRHRRALDDARRSDRALSSHLRDRLHARLRFARWGARGVPASAPPPRGDRGLDAARARVMAEGSALPRQRGLGAAVGACNPGRHSHCRLRARPAAARD